MAKCFYHNGYLEGPGISPYAAHADHTHDAKNQAASSAATVSALKDDLNALLIKMKEAGLMVKDQFTVTVSDDVEDSFAGHADRQYNTDKISEVSIEDNVITITLSSDVSELKDFDGGSGWGVHKWLGIGINAGIGTDITKLQYNGSYLTEADYTEAVTECGLSAGYFVRWVAADLVLVGNNNEKSKGYFTLSSPGYQEETYTLKIVEPD